LAQVEAGAKQAPDGYWYIPDPARSGKYLMIVPRSIDGPVSAASVSAPDAEPTKENVVRLLPVEEEAILRCYVTGSKEPASFQQLYDALAVPAADKISTSRLQVAVAQILLHGVQDELPQWAAIKGDELLLNRRRHRRHKEGLLPFHPQPIFSINWATSGPGFDWPEEYRVTYLPGFNKYVFTASRDGDDMWGCADHAIGVATSRTTFERRLGK
jgi:hypothetical protein